MGKSLRPFVFFFIFAILAFLLGFRSTSLVPAVSRFYSQSWEAVDQEEDPVLPRSTGVVKPSPTASVAEKLASPSAAVPSPTPSAVENGKLPPPPAATNWPTPQITVIASSTQPIAGSATATPQIVSRKPIHVVIAHKNRTTRLLLLLLRIGEIMTRTSDSDVRVTVVDNSETATSHETMLLVHSLAHDFRMNTTFLRILEGADDNSFNKASALLKGLSTVSSDDDIVFLCDADMRLPMNIFEAIRAKVVAKRSFYAPICFSLYQPANGIPQYVNIGVGNPNGKDTVRATDGWWRNVGYGNMAFYKSDWVAAGNVLEKFVNQTRWGHEDLEASVRLQQSGLRMVREKLEGFFHVWHANAPWKNTKR